ncbi:MAG: hypothetical protein F4X38_00300 [Acidimicrobiaceae bacterium]|nr:hypothetical protein [Acidimicrobiaceae bacterium]
MAAARRSGCRHAQSARVWTGVSFLGRSRVGIRSPSGAVVRTTGGRRCASPPPPNVCARLPGTFRQPGFARLLR